MYQGAWDFGVHLPTAGLIIGWVDITICILEMVGVCLTIYNLAFYTEKLPGTVPRTEKEMEYLKIVGAFALTCYFMFAFFHIISAVLLIIAIAEELEYLLFPWLITNPVSIILRSFGTVYFFFLTIFKDHSKFSQCLLNTSLTVILVWLWLIVYALFGYIRDNKN